MRQFVTFIVVGIVNTVFFLALFNGFRTFGLGPFTANGVAVVVSIAFSFWANSRFTFKVDHGSQQVRRFAEFAGVFVVTLAVSHVALAVLLRTIDQPTRVQESLVLATSGGALSVVRFLIVRAWVFSPSRSA